MQAVVNPGEAKQIEQDYAHTTLASSEMAAATAQSTAEAVQAFIQMLRERLQAARQKEQDPETEAQDAQPEKAVDLPQAVAEPIEIKMGREIVYREGYADKDPVNKLNVNKLKLLESAVNVPQQEGAEATADLKGAINIKAGDELIYRISKGAVETNRLQSETEEQADAVQAESSQPNAEQLSTPKEQPPTITEPSVPAEELPAPAAEPTSAIPDLKESVDSQSSPAETSAPSTAPTTPLEISKPETTSQTMQPAATKSMTIHTPRVVSILEVLDRQNQQVVEKATQKWMQQTTRVMRRSSQQLTERVVALAANIRSRQVASTAVDLLQKYGTAYSPGRGFYVAENYVISSKGRMVTVSDRQGIELMTARKTRLGLNIVKNDMVASQEADFMKARQQIQIQGVDGLSPEPPMRVRQLGNLAPAGDMGITRDLTALALAKTARKLLDVTGSRPNVQGKRVFQGGSQYRIEETPNSLKIQAGERGAILSIDNGKIKSDLTSKDVAYFRFIDRELSQDLQRHQPAKVTPLNSRQRSRAVGMAMGE
jgi:hypothetical protein